MFWPVLAAATDGKHGNINSYTKKSVIMTLNDLDKKRIKLDIKLSLFFSTIFFGGIILLLTIIFGIIIFFTNPVEGYLSRFFQIIFFFFVMFISINVKNILKFIDLREGNKIRIQTNSYKLITQKKSTFLITNETKIKLEIDSDLLKLIDPEKPIAFEYTKKSKTLLFISNNDYNMLEKLETEKD
ncbi:hypothetical protein [Flavobacterium sp.]|uniref:hypothetical protein n=1 Tax=Flavobacterium sp. TaxID=239 RepID=UPI0026325F6B|nr:hypothetical protein [Flavobacterium sp.]